MGRPALLGSRSRDRGTEFVETNPATGTAPGNAKQVIIQEKNFVPQKVRPCPWPAQIQKNERGQDHDTRENKHYAKLSIHTNSASTISITRGLRAVTGGRHEEATGPRPPHTHNDTATPNLSEPRHRIRNR